MLIDMYFLYIFHFTGSICLLALIFYFFWNTTLRKSQKLKGFKYFAFHPT